MEVQSVIRDYKHKLGLAKNIFFISVAWDVAK